MWIAVIAVALALAAGLGWLWSVSPGTPAPLRDAVGRVIPGSISERVTVEIGGIPQGMFIQSADPSNPVFLFLHGGPGTVEFFMEATTRPVWPSISRRSGGSSAARACRFPPTSRPRR